MPQSALTSISAVAALAVSLVVSTKPNWWESPPRLILIVITSLAVITCAVIEIVLARKTLPKKFSGKNRDRNIREYMTKLLQQSSGQCVMSSNNLSWVQDDQEKELFAKARQKELTLLMPQETNLSRRLAEGGASAYYYGADDDFRFESRFTVFNASRSDVWVAIGHGRGNTHLIHRTHSNSDPVYFMAKDLVALAKRNSNITSPTQGPNA
ncbi:hypothetical protein [Gordonia sp. OPL2]|uniref:hypothetical protein n=1 Tax=Gordonia sp. OPL2 TaxID=2486274 RepID=UPI001654FF27|nr:hypothetical protein [Gordonia sp. OPL2]